MWALESSERKEHMRSAHNTTHTQALFYSRDVLFASLPLSPFFLFLSLRVRVCMNVCVR